MSSSRAGLPRRPCPAIQAPTTTATTAIPPSQTSRLRPGEPLAVGAGEHRQRGCAGSGWRRRTAVIWCVAIRTGDAAADQRAPPAGRRSSRGGPRRTYSTTQAMVWASAVPVNSQRYTGTRASGSSGVGTDAVGRHAEDRPRLQQPRDVERRHQQRAEVVGRRAHRERDRLVARQQLAAAAVGRGRGDRDDQDRDVGGRQQDEHVGPGDAVLRHEGRRRTTKSRVTAASTDSAIGAARRDRPRRPDIRNRRRWRTSRAARTPSLVAVLTRTDPRFTSSQRTGRRSRRGVSSRASVVTRGSPGQSRRAR